MAIISGIWGAISSLGLVKVAGKFILSKTDWILGNWKLVVMGIQAAAIVTLLLFHAFKVVGLNAQLSDMEAAKISAEGKLAALDYTLQRNDAALAQCREINAANAIAYADMAERANRAEARARQIASEAETEIEVINDAAKDLRGRDAACRRLDDPLPDWFDHWLRQ